MPKTILYDVSISNEGNEVVELSFVKSFAGISTNTFDTLLTSLIKTARQEVEQYASISIVTKTIRAEWTETSQYVDLPYPLIGSITSVVSDGATLVLDTGYTVKGQDKKRIYGTFPKGLVVTYAAGYGVNLPEDLKLCITKNVAENFEQRSGFAFNQVALLPNNWRNVAMKYRPKWMF